MVGGWWFVLRSSFLLFPWWCRRCLLFIMRATERDPVKVGGFTDMHGDTEPLGNKIYAQRAPPANAPSYIRDLPRTVGISFNWHRTVNYRRCGENACSFTWRPGVRGSLGSLEAAYDAACQFMASPSVAEGILDPRPVFDGDLLSLPAFIAAYAQYSVSNMGMSSKTVLACITLSIFLFLFYSIVLYAEEELGCTRKNTTKFSAMFNGLSPVCQNLTDLKLHVQRHSTEYVNMFFTQLKVGVVLFARYIIDEMFH